MMIQQPSADQVEARLPTLPQDLRDDLFSIELTELVRRVGSVNGLDRDHTPLLADVIAWVLLGFVHSSNAAEAIQEHVGVNVKTARALADDLNSKLFKKYAAELEKIYTPMSATPAKPPSPMSPDAAPAPLGPVPMPEKADAGGGPTQPPKPQFAKPPAPAGQPYVQKPAAIPVLPVQPPSPPAPTSPAAQPKPAPFMMHQESASDIAPLAAGKDFKLDMPSDMFRAPQKKAQDVPVPPKTARLEIGRPAPPPKPPTASRAGAAPSAGRVVHYTDLRSAVFSPFAARPETLRSMAPAPKPDFTPKVPPPPPMPAAMPASATAPPPAPSGPGTPRPEDKPKPPKVVNFGPEEVK
jgi:hypothetical protein